MEYFRFGLKLTLGFLAAGTIILILFYFNPSVKIALMAYQFTIVAIIATWIYVLILLVKLLKREISIPKLLKTLAIMAINIPVGILYSYIMVWLLSYARITFSNYTGADIARIDIKGCEQRQLDGLGYGSSRTVWIKIPANCSIEIAYQVNGEIKTEKVIGHLTPEEGIIISYELR
jgi:hypothetical protein